MNVKKIFENIIQVQIKRAITLAVGAGVTAGLIDATKATELETAALFVASQVVLSVAYWAYDKYVKPHVLKLAGAAVRDAVADK